MFFFSDFTMLKLKVTRSLFENVLNLYIIEKEKLKI